MLSSLELRGVNGWLKFLVIALCVLGPLGTIAQTIGSIRKQERSYPALLALPAWGNAKTAMWAVTIIYCIAIFAAGQRLRHDFRRSTPRYVIATLWLAGPVLAAVGLIVIGRITGVSVAQLEPAGTLVRPVLVAAIWSAYLTRSERVRNTYVGES